MDDQDILNLLVRKIETLEKIRINTAIQLRFVRRHEMRGLQRLLNEREKLFSLLNTINKELSSDESWKNNKEAESLVKDIREKQAEILAINSQILSAALDEKEKIYSELKQIRVRNRIQNVYIRRWYPRGGTNFNLKG